MDRKVPLVHALAWIALSVVCVTTLAMAGWSYFKKIQKEHHLYAIVQTGPEKEPLKTTYLAELLHLSVDEPVDLYTFDCAAARRKLLSSPLIKAAQVATFVPGLLYIDYTVRHPVAYLSDYSNTAIDAEGVLIPCEPFCTPKRIPHIYLGLPFLDSVWGRKVSDPKLDLAFNLQRIFGDHFPSDKLIIRLIDVSRSDSSSFGERQMMIRLEERAEPVVRSVILRLSPSHYQQALADYAVLRSHLKDITEESVVIDMRIPQLAFIEEIK